MPCQVDLLLNYYGIGIIMTLLRWNTQPEIMSCSVTCRSRGPPSLLNTVAIRNTDIEFTLSMEGPQYYSELNIKPTAYRNYQYYATTDFKSEIPVPYFSWSEYNIQHPAVDFGKAIKGASFIASNCDSKSDREEKLSELMKVPSLRVDSLGRCMNNALPPPGVNSE